MCICVHVCMCECLHACKYINVHVFMYTCLCMCLCAQACMIVCMPVNLCFSFVVLLFQIILSKLSHLVPACTMAAVPAVGGAQSGRQTLVLYATVPSRQKGEIPFDASVLYRELATVLPSHSLPDDIIIVGEFPLTPHGEPVNSNIPCS